MLFRCRSETSVFHVKAETTAKLMPIIPARGTRARVKFFNDGRPPALAVDTADGFDDMVFSFSTTKNRNYLKSTIN